MSFFNPTITTEGLRHYNRAIVLSSIREHGPSAHTVIAERTSLASGTVSVITAEFLDEGVLEKIEDKPAGGRGRPRILFAPREAFAHFAFIRISAGQVEYSLANYRGALIDRKTISRDSSQTDAAVFCDDLRAQLFQFFDRSALKPNDISVISITTKGEVDEASQQLLWSPVFGDQRINFKTLFHPEFKSEINVTNELCFVAHNVMQTTIADDTLNGPRDRVAVLSLTDSISLGVAKLDQQGEIELSAPSIGHMPHDAKGPLCRCGGHGCLETYAGFYGILRTAFDAPTEVIPAKFIPIEQMRNIAKLARSGDRLAGFAFRQAGNALGLCLSRMFNVLGPMPLTIVGSGLEFYDLLKDGLEEKLNDSFQVRVGQAPSVSFRIEEGLIAFESNLYESLRKFDQTEIATRKFARDRKV